MLFDLRYSSPVYITDKTEIVLIEPPCGSNTTIITHNNEALFIDSGYACYKDEMEKLFREILPRYDKMKKKVLITHADVDHCGLLPLFDEIIASERSADCLSSEYRGEDGFRERNMLHKPYINICKTLTRYFPPEPEKSESYIKEEQIWICLSSRQGSFHSAI